MPLLDAQICIFCSINPTCCCFPHLAWLISIYWSLKTIYLIACDIFLVKPAEISALWHDPPRMRALNSRDHGANRVPRRRACQVLAEQAIAAGSTAAENQQLQEGQGPVGGTGKDEEDLGVGEILGGTSPFNPYQSIHLGIPKNMRVKMVSWPSKQVFRVTS